MIRQFPINSLCGESCVCSTALLSEIPQVMRLQGPHLPWEPLDFADSGAKARRDPQFRRAMPVPGFFQVSVSILPTRHGAASQCKAHSPRWLVFAVCVPALAIGIASACECTHLNANSNSNKHTNKQQQQQE